MKFVNKDVYGSISRCLILMGGRIEILTSTGNIHIRVPSIELLSYFSPSLSKTSLTVSPASVSK